MIISADNTELAPFVAVYDENGKRIPQIQIWNTEKNEGYAYIQDDMGRIMRAFDDPTKPLEVLIRCPGAKVYCRVKELADKHGLEYREYNEDTYEQLQ
jgi:hypothetical protein